MIYHTTVRKLRSGHRNAVVGLLLNILQGLTLVIAFFVLFQLLGLRNAPLRGDFMLFLMTGVFLYLTHVKSITAVFGSGGPTAPMMQHAPMNTIVAIVSAALSTLYMQMLTVIIVLTIYHIGVRPITIDQPVAALGMFLLAWLSGCVVGLIFLAMAPWLPNFTPFSKNLYVRVNMFVSGKMFVANTLPASMIAFFDWNPLFHIIDQIRGFVFLHYTPHVTEIAYPVYICLMLLVLGMMGEFYSRQHVSLSWFAGR